MMRSFMGKRIAVMLGVSVIAFLTIGIENSYASKRLLYPQEQALKSMGNKLNKLITKFRIYQGLYKKKTFTKKPEPGLGILDDLTSLEAEFEKANLPQDNKKVKNFKTWLVSLRKNTPKLEAAYTAAYEAAAKDPKNAPLTLPADYDEDVKRLKTMYRSYKNPRSVFRNPEKAKILIPQFQEEYAFFKNIPIKYGALIKANKAKSIPTWIRTNKKYMEKFEQAQKEYAAGLPSQIESAMSTAMSTAEKAKADNKPMFFKGGVKQRLNQADSLLSVYEAIKGKEDPTLKQLDQKFADIKTKIGAIETAMAEELLASVSAPQDVYSGSDKSKLKGMIEVEWKKLYPQDEMLAIRLPSSDWKRSTSWKWNNSGWYKVDTSVLPARVVVKMDDKIAMLYPAFINKNHLKGDALNVGAHTKKRGYVIQKMLLKNFK